MVRRTKQDVRSACPLSCSLELIGDRWTMLVLRDLFIGKTRFGEFLEAPEGISTNVLTDRLAMMERSGLIESRPYSLRPKRLEYTLTGKGEALLPVLQELCRWGNTHLAGTCTPPASFMNRKPKSLPRTGNKRQ